MLQVLIVALAFSAFFGFAALGRFNRSQSALYILAAESLVLMAYITRYALVQNEISRIALMLAINLQLFYIGVSICGWFLGRVWRQRRLG